MRPLLYLSVLLISFAARPLHAVAGSSSWTPVMVGGEPELDACGATGIVAGLKPVPGNSLAVREGPGLEFRRIGELRGSDRVWLCDRKDGWLGIVYGEDCGVSTPIAERAPYAGPCKSGWVSERYIEPEAG